MTFDEAFYKITDKLDVLMHSEKREDAIAAGHKMIQMLANIDTDDDYFPVYNIELICKIIDPFGTDKELEDIVRKWRESYFN